MENLNILNSVHSLTLGVQDILELRLNAITREF